MQRAEIAQLILLLLAVGLLAAPVPVLANKLQITEIMYDPDGADSGREWVEVHNTSDQSITITDWNFRENETDHRISEAGDGTQVAAGSYAILADKPDKFRSDHSSADPVFDSTFSLNNSGEDLSLINSQDKTADSVQYTPDEAADDTGSSLQYIDGSWQAADPTPATANAQSDTGEEDTNESDASDDSEETAGTTQILAPKAENDSDQNNSQNDSNQSEAITVNAGPDKHALAGVQMHLEGVATASDPDLLEGKTVKWSLGNGDTQSEADIFYTYEHPGEYVATLMVKGENQTISDQATVIVTKPDIAISQTQSGSDGFVKIANNLSRDVNLSGWHLQAPSKSVTLPDYTVALAGDTLTLANQATELRRVSRVKLLYPGGKIADTHPDPDRTSEQNSGSQATTTTSSSGGGVAEDTDSSASAEQSSNAGTVTTTDMESLFASSSQAAAAGAQTAPSQFWRWAGLLVVIVTAGAAGAYTVDQLVASQKEESEDLLSETFDINEI